MYADVDGSNRRLNFIFLIPKSSFEPTNSTKTQRTRVDIARSSQRGEIMSFPPAYAHTCCQSRHYRQPFYRLTTTRKLDPNVVRSRGPLTQLEKTPKVGRGPRRLASKHYHTTFDPRRWEWQRYWMQGYAPEDYNKSTCQCAKIEEFNEARRCWMDVLDGSHWSLELGAGGRV